MKKGKGKNNGLLPSSFRIISSCLKTVSTNACTVASTVRSAGASVASSITSPSDDHKDQVTWAGFDKLELDQKICKRVLLLGYLNGFQVLDVEDASGFSEVVSKRDGPVSFLQMQPFPVGVSSDGQEGFRKSHPLLLVVAGDGDEGCVGQTGSGFGGLGREGGKVESQSGNGVKSATAVRFYSLKSHSYVHVLRFRSVVCMIRCCSKIVAVGLATQIYCFDALTLENKFSVLTYPVPQLSGQVTIGVNVGYGPMAVGPRWLAYPSNNPLPSNVGCISPQNLSPSPRVSPSTSPSNGSLVARYAMESSKHMAAGLLKYCQDMLPDGSNSSIPSISGWKVGRVTGSDMDNAGTVIVKDFVSRAIISQFKAHSSPISALCFDPSGTLLVTASVYGNSINIFRIMPSCARKGSGVPSCNRSATHVHLYRYHRGITPATIQDICFSRFSQWVAIVSSKGTCHLFVLSPFGGDTGFQIISSKGEDPSLLPVLSLPWWATSSTISHQQSLPPPSPVALSVVSRIKYSSFGWLNTIQSSNANVSGKVFVPSGAISVIFHNSMSHPQPLDKSNMKSLEQLLVYTPSGHIVQHELLPSVGPEPNESGSRIQSASAPHMQEDEFRVKVEPIQWWDVCRRSEWPEKGEPCSNTCDRQDGINRVQDKMYSGDGYGFNFFNISDDVGEKTVKPSTGKPHERSHWYISNAEVQVNFGRIPIWQNSKICFYSLNSGRTVFSAGGESEIEKISANEIEIRRKELLPVFDHFQGIRTSWNESLSEGKHLGSASPVLHVAEDKQTADRTVFCHSKPASLSSTESSDGGSSRRTENLLDLDQVTSCCQMLGEIYPERVEAINAAEPSQQNKFASALFLKHDLDKNNFLEVSSEMQNACPEHSFPDGQCKTPVHDGSNMLTEEVTDDVDSTSSSHEREQPEDDSSHEREQPEDDSSHEREQPEDDSSHEREQPEDDEDGETLGGLFGFSD
ncbi:unnamed protein product [Lathyrus sativus]|nr:unnamed protein product [Lathyrus sativus]